MIQLKEIKPRWYLLTEEVPHKDYVSVMEWEYMKKSFRSDRALLVLLKPGVPEKALEEVIKDKRIIRIASHEPIKEFLGVKSVDDGDTLYEMQIVAPDGRKYIDDYGFNVFVTSRLAPFNHPDIDLRNDNAEQPEIVSELGLDPIHNRVRYRDTYGSLVARPEAPNSTVWRLQ